jgi:alanine dehydrogenase
MSSDEGALVLTNDDIKQIVDLPSYIDALDLAFTQLADGIAQNMPRRRLFTPLGEPETHHWFNVIAGVVPGAKTAAIRINSGLVKFETAFGMPRMEFPGALVGHVHLYDVETGTLRAILHDFYINPIRVACTSALGAKYLAREDSRVMALLGTGWQARWHISAFIHVRPFNQVRIYSPNTEHRLRFVEQQRKIFPETEFVAAETPESAVAGADVVVAATNAIEPALLGEWIDPGTHVVSISGADRLDQRREFDEETVTRASIVVVTSKEQLEFDQQDELLDVVKNNKISMEQIVELSEVARGGVNNLQPESIRFHYNNTGTGIQFAAVGSAMLEAAIARGIGTRIPYTWRGRGI